MLHYRSKDWYVGDVHPYYEDGTLYLLYLKPNGITRCDACFSDPSKVVTSAGALAVTKDYRSWKEYSPGPIIVNLVKRGGTYYSCRGSGAGSFWESTNLVDWRPGSTYRLDLDKNLFPAGARDYACFWDEDEGGMRVTMNAYFTNEHNGAGKGLECCVGISEVIEPDVRKEPAQRVLLRIDNSGRELIRCREPECNQMIRIADRWYLVTSLARQTIHWVGPPSYWIGEANTRIDGQDWGGKREYRLDGEDLCAAQVAERSGRFFIFGWIPLNWNGQEWGGHLNLPREIFPLPDGKLASRLDPEYARSIAGQRTTHPAELRPGSGPRGGTATVTEPVTAPKDFGVRVIFDLRGVRAAGIGLDAVKEIAVLLEREDSRIRIVRLKGGKAEFEFARLEIDPGEWKDRAELHVIYDEDIVEAFLDERYSLCARVDAFNGNSCVSAFTDGPGAVRSLETYRLKAP